MHCSGNGQGHDMATQAPAVVDGAPGSPAAPPDARGSTDDLVGTLITAQWRHDCLTAHALGVPKATLERKLDQMRQQLEAIYAVPRA